MYTQGTVNRSGVTWGASNGSSQQSNAAQPANQSRNDDSTWGRYAQATSGRLTSAADGSARGTGSSTGTNAFTTAATRRQQAADQASEYSSSMANIEATRQRSNTTTARDSAVQQAELDASVSSERADLNVWEAEQAITDGNNRRGRDVAALTRGRRTVGGGGFSAAATGRGRTVLGSSVTGGLDAANRAAAKKTKSDALDTKYAAQQGVIARTAEANNTAASAEAATATQANNAGRSTIRMA